MAKKKTKTESGDSPESAITVEAAIEELGEIVSLLESGQAPLEQSLSQFERGMKLLRNCHQILDAATGRIELVTRLDAAGDVQTTDFDGTASISREARSREAGSGTAGRRDENPDVLF